MLFDGDILPRKEWSKNPVKHRILIELSKDLRLVSRNGTEECEFEGITQPCYLLFVDSVFDHLLNCLRVRANTWTKQERAKHLTNVLIDHLRKVEDSHDDFREDLQINKLELTTPHMTIKYLGEC